MTFNQQLITKARKGEIAILNDGSVEELDALVEEIWPGDFPPSKHALANKYFIAHPNDKKVWYNTYEIEIPAHSVKDFFMPTTEKMEDFEVHNGNAETVIPGQPRTYRVTRRNMKNIWMLVNSTSLRDLVLRYFDCFEDEVDLSHEEVKWMIEKFLGEEVQKLFRLIFPEYFFIPEGEPVLVRWETDWRIAVSDGKGGFFKDAKLSGESGSAVQIIPYTKQPPK